MPLPRYHLREVRIPSGALSSPLCIFSWGVCATNPFHLFWTIWLRASVPNKCELIPERLQDAFPGYHTPGRPMSHTKKGHFRGRFMNANRANSVRCYRKGPVHRATAFDFYRFTGNLWGSNFWAIVVTKTGLFKVTEGRNNDNKYDKYDKYNKYNLHLLIWSPPSRSLLMRRGERWELIRFA